MTRAFLRKISVSRWTSALLLTMTLFAAMLPARAQMTGDYSSDVVIINTALTATTTATAKGDAETSRLAMEELYRQWRLFRAKNFEDPANDPLFVPDMEKVEAALFEASKLIDSGQLAEAHKTLQHARLLLRAVNKRQPAA